MPKTVQERFWEKVDRSESSNDCWIWNAGRTASGYGHFSINSRSAYAHRIAYELSKGSIPEGMFVCHSCDNPPCCNPDHLWLGTAIDNIRDRDTKGCGPGKGQPKKQKAIKTVAKAGNPILTWDEVVEIRRRHAATDTSLSSLARDFGVSVSSIWSIVRNKTWTSPNSSNRVPTREKISPDSEYRQRRRAIAKEQWARQRNTNEELSS